MEIVLRAFLRVIKELEKAVIPECAGGVSAARGSIVLNLLPQSANVDHDGVFIVQILAAPDTAEQLRFRENLPGV